MGNVTEKLEIDKAINCNVTKNNKTLNQNQKHIRNLNRLKTSKKILLFFIKNIRGLNSNKIDELSVSLPTNAPHTICLTEHHLDTYEIDTIILTNYKLESKFCRSTFKNGGACIFTHKSIQSSNINLNEFCIEKDLEIFAIKLHLPSYEISITTIYRSPSGNFQYFIDNLEKVLNKIYLNTTEVIICGDININYLIDSTYKQTLNSLLASYGLCSTIQFPTRIQKNSHSTIDNIFINTFKYNFSTFPIINGLSNHDA
jgi:exonuclease III